jgi:hypothetical protein
MFLGFCSIADVLIHIKPWNRFGKLIFLFNIAALSGPGYPYAVTGKVIDR